MHEHGACQPTPSKHHSHARCVHLATTQPNEPQPDGDSHRMCGASRRAAPAPLDAKNRETDRRDNVSSRDSPPQPHRHRTMLGFAFHTHCTNETDNLMPRSPLRTRDASDSPRHGGLSMQASAWRKATTHGQRVHRTMPGVPSVALVL